MLPSHAIRIKHYWVTYKQVVTIIFKEMLGDMVDFYIVDLVLKSRQGLDHLEHLEIISISSANIN